MTCPCGSKEDYETCCGIFHNGSTFPETAEQLMRSRYAAYCYQLVDYIYETTCPQKRDKKLLDEIKQHAAQMDWLDLKVVKTQLGGKKDKVGKVEFIASYHLADQTGQLHEYSRFKRNKGRWCYFDGILY